MSLVLPDVFAVFSTTDWPLSRAIRYLDKSQVSHCSVHFCVFGLPLVLQASIGGVKFCTEATFLKDHRIVKKLRFKVDVTKGIQSAMTLLNSRYDYVGLLGYLPVMIGRWFGRKVKNWLASPNALVCSEFLLHVDAFDEVPEWNDLEWETTTPQQLMESCGGSFEEVF